MHRVNKVIAVVAVVAGLAALTVAAHGAQAETAPSSAQPLGPLLFTPTPTATPTATPGVPPRSRHLPLVLREWTSPVRPQPPFDAEAYATVGNSNAPVAIVQFADFQCPFCQRHHDQTEPLIYDQYIRTGLVRYVVKDFPLSSIHPQAQKASEAAECAGAQGAYWSMHDKLYEEQQQWSGNAGSLALFKQYARSLGLDGAACDACLDGDATSAEVAADRQEGIAAQVRGTPWFFFFGPDGSAVLIGAQPYSAFQQIIDSLLNGQAPAIRAPADRTSPAMLTAP
jgi:protein-disulfide isomerase